MPRPIISKSLQTAIEQLRPELPGLLGADYTTFVAQLDALLAGGSESQVLDLCRKYSVIDERLQDILDQQEEEEDTIRGGLGLFGDPLFRLSDSAGKHRLPHYRCEAGLHIVAADQVEEHDAAGNALCPLHGTPMIKIVEKESKPNQEQG